MRSTWQCARRRDGKRRIVVDTMGLLLSVVVHPADVQDRDGAFQLLRRTRRLFPFIERIFADGGYAGKKMALVVWHGGMAVANREAFRCCRLRSLTHALDRRTHLCLAQPFPRLARDFELYARTVAAFIRLAMIRIMLKRLVANPSS
jgi:hypothetical protein